MQKMGYSLSKSKCQVKTMNKRQDLLDSIRKRYYDTYDEECKVFLYRLYNYYKQTDMETGRKHGEIFKSLYLTKNPLTYDELSEQYYIDTYTLDRYRQRYNKLAKAIIQTEQLQQLNSAYSVG